MVTPRSRSKVPGSSATHLTPDLASGARRHGDWTSVWSPLTEGTIASSDAGDQSRHMKKRIAAAVLWFFTGWFVGSFGAFAFGLTPALGPIVATAAAMLIAMDPRQVIWARPTAPSVAHARQAHNPA